jgi:short-subunit dehydrogenase
MASYSRRMQIAGKVVLITGASQGIGRACVDVFRKRGARLVITARSDEKLRQAAGPDTLIVAGDITDADIRRRVVEATIERYGVIDVLVNNAGVGLYSPAWKASALQAREMFELNFFVPLEMVQLVVPHMRRQRSGVIVNVGSIAGKITLPWFTLYSASKYALGSLTDGLRIELKRDGIHAIAVCPGYVHTDFQSHVLDGAPPESMRRSRPMAIAPEKCAETIARAVERNARTVVTPWAGWLLIILERLLPGVVDFQLERMQERPR